VAYYVQLLDRVRALPEWKDFMAQGAFKPSNLTGAPFVAWLDRTESFHRVLMREAKLTYAASTPAVVPGKPTTVKN
jgi:tripartite-type tricarboxylate transporter receptor subunit TctC